MMLLESNCIWFGEREGIIPKIPLGDFSKYDFSLSNPIINSSSIIRKELCYWDPKWNVGIEDYDLWLRLRKQKKRFFNCKAVLVKHRIHKESAFNSKGNHNYVEQLIQYHYGKSR